ncbi:hypothetical protein V1478_014592 [Vespula squamosa]|uniref:Uncharacterized protein n=1 Tax=Vespula squamosa TaxID=30214 RepID=A0ABD2A2Q2_VESSQ
MKYKLTVSLFERSIGRSIGRGRLRSNFRHCPRREYARDSCETFWTEHPLNLQECTQTAIRLQGLLEKLHQRLKLERRCKLNPRNVGTYERASEKNRLLARNRRYQDFQAIFFSGYAGSRANVGGISSKRQSLLSPCPSYLVLSKVFSRKPNYLAFYSKEYRRKAENRGADKHVGSSMVEGECLWQFVLELEANAFEHKYRTRYNEISLKLKASSSSCTYVRFDLHLGERTSLVIASRRLLFGISADRLDGSGD